MGWPSQTQDVWYTDKVNIAVQYIAKEFIYDMLPVGTQNSAMCSHIGH